eukprot:GHRR01017294.1.p1 GENE.GHRR01017294.1~~GHRR01017294.1.p1  ORF type:complete len:503 (+),score=147.23 GHRR01017294.1:667-2175(+)
MLACRRSICLALLVHLCTAVALQDRSGAFIGYIEAGYGHCQDRLPSCEKDSSLNKCLTDPYNMRRFCPVSCSVAPCVHTGSVLDKYVFRGHASPSGTGAYYKSLQGSVAVNHFNTVGWGLEDITDSDSPVSLLQLSSLGLGTYLGAVDDATDEQVLAALMYSVARGWNVIDTAANYRNGRAESAVGHALSLLLAGNEASQFPPGRAEVTRDMLFISSKAGFLNTALKQELLDLKVATNADIVGGIHCLTRACVRASVTASLAKMRIATLDLLYLHNPAEIQLLARGRAGFMEVLKQAFAELELMRREGKVRGYGIASWDCFRLPPDNSLHLNLEEVVNLAKQVGGEQHGFMAIQLPINIKMTEAFSHSWQLVENKTASDAATLAAAVAAAARAALAGAAAATLPLPTEDTLQADSSVSSSTTTQPDASQTASSSSTDTAGAVLQPVTTSQPSPPTVIYDSVALMEAAKRLGVHVFASGPLMEVGSRQNSCAISYSRHTVRAR